MNKRHIKFDNIHNFRDIGGYETADGKKVKWGKIYRSGQLYSPTHNDIDKIYSLNIKTIMDFRSKHEINDKPNYVFENVNYLHSPAVDDGKIVSDMRSLANMDKNIMKQFYIDVPINNKTYKKMFRLLLETENLPMVIHCTAGNDRTGAASALILLALGVDVETVIEDYLLTNIYLLDFKEKILLMYKSQLDDIGYKNMDYMLSTQQEFLKSSIENISKIYGNFDKYFREDINLTESEQNLLCEMYLE
jgi:protein-tyrosine phosphatase